MAQSPFNGWSNAFFEVEWRVNGVWNTILTQTFRPTYVDGGWIISPEVYPKPEDTNGLKADLTVSKLNHSGGGNWGVSNPMLVYEGKGGNSTEDWTKISEQLSDWCMMMALHRSFDMWCIGSSGKVFRIYQWYGDKIQEVVWNGNRLAPTSREITLDLTNNGDWTTLLAALEYTKTHRPQP